MFRKTFALLLLSLVVAVVAGCSAAAPAPNPIPPTRTPRPTFTVTPDWTPTSIAIETTAPVAQATVAPAATDAQPEATTAASDETPDAAGTPAAGETPGATGEPTAEAPEKTTLTALQNVNVRTGPGTAYPAIGRLTGGQSFEVTGRNDEGDWVKFDYNGRDGWVTAALVTVGGDLDAVEVAQAPAIPTPRPQPTARPRPTNPPAPPPPTNPPAPQFAYSLMEGSANCQPNPGSTYFNGFVRDRSNNLLNGVCVHIAFFGPRQTKCSGCGGVGDGIWGFAPFGGNPPPPGTTVEIYVTSCDGVPPGGDLSTFDAPPAPQSNKFVRTLSQGEQCTGITFIKN